MDSWRSRDTAGVQWLTIYTCVVYMVCVGCIWHLCGVYLALVRCMYMAGVWCLWHVCVLYSKCMVYMTRVSCIWHECGVYCRMHLRCRELICDIYCRDHFVVCSIYALYQYIACVRCIWHICCVYIMCGVCVMCIWRVCGLYTLACVRFIKYVWRIIYHTSSVYDQGWEFAH